MPPIVVHHQRVTKQHHQRHGFTNWWLHEPPLDYPAFPQEWSRPEVLLAYSEDPALERNYYDYSPAHLELAREVLRTKAGTTGRSTGLDRSPMACRQ